MIALWLIIFYISNLYEIRLSKNNAQFYSLLYKTIAISSAIAVAFFYLVRFTGIAPRRNLFIYIVIFTFLNTLWRYVYNKLLSLTSKNNTIIVGFNQNSFELAKFLNQNPQYGYYLKYILDTEKKSVFSFEDVDFKEISGKTDIERILQEEKIKTVIVTPEAYKIPRLIDIFYKSLNNKIEFFNLANFYEKITGKVPLENINQVWFLENITEGKKRAYEFMKRILDIISAVILGVISLPFYPFIIFAIKWDSEGPIFYKQRRVGQGSKEFEIIKFRTMYKNAERRGAIWAQKNDPRTTKVGRFLRKIRLDEIPQLWNILKGDMSFVGPRAERPEFRSKLKKEVPFYEERYLIKPGLSGWAQVKYRYGASVADTREKLQYDLYYIKHRTIVFDLGIILQTIRIVLAGGGR